MRILGIHDGHNSSAALVDDGVLIAAVQEERLTRRKNQGGFPTNAVREVLGICNLAIKDIDQVAFSGYGKSKVETREDVLANYLRKIEPPKAGFAKNRAQKTWFCEKNCQAIPRFSFCGIKKT